MQQDGGLIPAKALRLIALYLLLLVGLAARPLDGFGSEAGRWLQAGAAAHQQVATSTPAQGLLARPSAQLFLVSSIDPDGPGSDDLTRGFAVMPAHGPASAPTQLVPRVPRIAGLSAGHAYSPRAPPPA
ncbi:hypothetical protein [Sphingosinicella sp. CPCC 101087]|uniref:hypothetical protein n=1 Tax=Sphingosinicella sp. CPCC 101087 TaxID=2497754 RepID=UPI00101C79AF|nr:hypothetical protein [Sphingosinicella sp. CPCC 101087]